MDPLLSHVLVPIQEKPGLSIPDAHQGKRAAFPSALKDDGGIEGWGISNSCGGGTAIRASEERKGERNPPGTYSCTEGDLYFQPCKIRKTRLAITSF